MPGLICLAAHSFFPFWRKGKDSHTWAFCERHNVQCGEQFICTQTTTERAPVGGCGRQEDGDCVLWRSVKKEDCVEQCSTARWTEEPALKKRIASDWNRRVDSFVIYKIIFCSLVYVLVRDEPEFKRRVCQTQMFWCSLILSMVSLLGTLVRTPLPGC